MTLIITTFAVVSKCTLYWSDRWVHVIWKKEHSFIFFFKIDSKCSWESSNFCSHLEHFDILPFNFQSLTEIMGCQRFKVHLTFWYNSIIFVPSNLSKSLFPFLLTHTHPHVYGFNLLNTLISCQLNCRRALVAFSLLCFPCSLSKLSMPFKIYSINLNCAAIIEWLHYQLIHFCFTEVFLYLTRA